MRRIALGLVIVLALSCCGLGVWLRATSEGRAVANVVDFRLRRLAPVRSPGVPGTLTGRITTTQGDPVPDAFALVSTDRGQVFWGRADEQGHYRITGVPPGAYVSLAAAWGYTMERPTRGEWVRVQAGRETANVDFALSTRAPYRPAIEGLVVAPAETVTGTFPGPVTARRSQVSFEHAGLRLTDLFLYEPPGDERLPALILSLPTAAIGWEPISVALANEGFVVLAIGPAAERGLDIEAHARDLVAAATLLFDGRLTSRADPAHVGGLAGSFSSVLLFRALRDLPPLVGVVTMGGISDAFLGYQALFRDDLEIPAPYDTFIAALDRPDRHPEIYLAASPAFFAANLPPTLIIHTPTDRVVPVDQAIRFDRALAEAGTPHELVLYEDLSHYLDPNNPTEETRRVYDKVVEFLREGTMSDER